MTKIRTSASVTNVPKRLYWGSTTYFGQQRRKIPVRQHTTPAHVVLAQSVMIRAAPGGRPGPAAARKRGARIPHPYTRGQHTAAPQSAE